MGNGVKSLAEVEKHSSYLMVSLQVLEPIMCHMQKLCSASISLVIVLAQKWSQKQPHSLLSSVCTTNLSTPNLMATAMSEVSSGCS